MRRASRPRRHREMPYNRSRVAAGAAVASASPARRPAIEHARASAHRPPPKPLPSTQSSTYAIVRSGGKQYRVERGQTLLVERLAEEAGATVALEPLMVRTDDSILSGADELAWAEVQARIVGHERGPKLRVFKFKPKRGYKRRTGHRQELTRLEVTSISGGESGRRRQSRAQAPAESSATAPASAPAREEGHDGS